MITDPVFVSSKLYKNGKFELELVSQKIARKTAVFLFALDRENRVQRRRHCGRKIMARAALQRQRSTLEELVRSSISSSSSRFPFFEPEAHPVSFSGQPFPS